MIMANLLDTIKQNRSALATEKPEVEDQTLKVQKLLRAKTGREVGPAETATSNIAEQVAQGTTASQIQQLGSQMQLQQAGEDIEQARLAQQERLQRQETDQARKFQTMQTKMETNKLLNDLSRDRATLSLEKDKSRLEQTAFLLAMQDKKYTDQLQDAGRKQRLDDQVAFNEAIQKESFGLELDLLKKKLGNQDILASSDRQFQEMLASMSIAEAQQIAQMEMAYDQQVAAIKAELMRQGVSAQAAQAAAETQAAGAQSILKGGIGIAQAAGEGKFSSKTDSDTTTNVDTSPGSRTTAGSIA